MPKDKNQSRIIAGRYRLREELGAGAQGTVYLAEDLGRGGMHVAVKLVEETVGGSREEPADALLRHFRHPHWASVLDGGANHPEGWFQVVELIRGRSLERLVGPHPIEQRWKLHEDGPRVLGAKHRHGHMHYEESRSPLMLDHTRGQTAFVLTDGGLAHLGPVTGVARGTPQFMAPEVTELGTHDHRSDLYSLGLVAYRFATGRDPIEGGDAGVLRRRREENAPRARTIRAEIPLTLDAVLAGLLSRDPGARPHDAFDLLDKLSDARGEPVARFTHDEGVAAAEGGALVGGTDALARVRAIVAVLEERRAAGTGRLAAARAPKIADPVLILRGRSSSGATRVASEALDLARTQGVPALLMSGRETSGDRRGPLRHLVDGMATLQRAPDEPVEEIRLDLGRRRDLGREERSHAITRAVEHFVRGIETTAKRTPFMLVVQDFAELPERAQQAIRVLSRHLLALRENGGSASAPSVVLVVDIGAAEAESFLIPDAQNPERPLLDTPPLERHELLAFTSARFPGIAPDETDLDRILAVSEGLPGTLAAMLAEGSRRGDLRYEAGRWSWNVDALDSYELRTGLSPVLAEALEAADDDVRALLGYLSLVEAPLEEAVVQELWRKHSSRPLPSTPLISRTARGPRIVMGCSSRAVAIGSRPAANRLPHVASTLASALSLAAHGSEALERSRALMLAGRPDDSLAAISDVWPELHSAQRARAQEHLAHLVDAMPSLLDEAPSRAALSRLLEYGSHATNIALRLSEKVDPKTDLLETGQHILQILAESRHEREALRLASALAKSAQATERDSAQLNVQSSLMLMNLHRGDEARKALAAARKSLRATRSNADRDWTTLAKFLMADAQLRFLGGSPLRARMSLRAAKRCARNARSPSLMARVYSNMGIVEQQLGDPAAATRKLERALALRRQLGDLDGVLSTLINLGRLHQHLGSLVKSAAVFQEAAGRALRHAQPVLLGKSLLFLGQVYDQQMNSRLAAATLQRAVSASLRSGTGPSAVLAAWELAPIAAALGDLDTAGAMLQISSSAGRRRSTTYSRATHHFVAGLVSLHVGNDRRAALCFSRALRQSDGLYVRTKKTLTHLGRLLAMLGVEQSSGKLHRPAPADPARFSYRTGLWLERVATDSRAGERLPLARFLPQPTARTVATGSDRRLLAECVLRATRTLSPSESGALMTLIERNLALAGEKYIQGRFLARRSVIGNHAGATQSAQVFSRALALADEACLGQKTAHWPLPQEHQQAHESHSATLGESTQTADLRTDDSHALAHRLLLKHGFTAAPDGRIANALRRVLAATGRMNAGAGLDNLLQGMTEDTIEITGAERACVVLIDPNSSQHLRVEKGSSSEHLGVEVEDLSKTVIQRVIDSREPLLMHDVFDDQELMGRPSITSLSLRSILCVPMLRGDTLFGVLYADSASAAGSFDSVDQEVLSLFAEQAAAGLETHRLVADVQNSMAELKAMQERLVRGERLRTMGELSSGVAHEFNNLLTSILARVQLIALDPVSPELKRDLDLIEKACLDAAEVVRRLQSFTRREREEDFKRVDLTEICSDAVEFLRPLWSTRRRHGRAPVTVKVRTDEALPVDGNATELREVVTNLLKNSLDALADGGHIDIEAREIAGGVILRMEDDGPGIPDDIQARVFDPFFTTKGERGTGLGLCLSQQIVERHGGEMALWSQLGEGTRFTIELPLAETTEGGAHNGASTPDQLPLKVLVVDDDENVRLPLCRFLERSGYDLESAADGEAGLASARSRRPDVVISDVAMPGMSGIDLCAQIQKEIPDVPVILMSGWTSGTDPSRARRAGAAALLKKPFALQQVEVALRGIADERDRRQTLRRLG